MRLFLVIRILIIYRFDKLLPSTWWLKFLQFILLFIPWSYYKLGKEPRGVRITKALEDLGVIFIKFGQVLSTRRDLLADDIGAELIKLQDNCQPFDNQHAIQIIEQSLAKMIAEVFDNFSKQPLASASIAQVYTANTKQGDEVVIKVVRPGIDKQIKRDLKMLYRLANVANLHPQLKRVRSLEVITEFEHIITAELDMKAEAANTELLGINFKDSDVLYVPKVYWDLTTSDILVLERIYGTPIGDIATLRQKNIDFKTLAENGVKIFFTQVFKHNFFHADMHPGNIFVGDDGMYKGVDFGIMGSLSNEDKYFIANIFLAFFDQDYQKVAKLYIDANWVNDDTNIIAFENAIRSICQPMFAKSLGDISFGEVLLSLFKQARKFDIYVQPQLLLLDKTLLNIEGLGRQLYPELNLWTTAKPLLEEIMQDELSLKNKVKNIKNDLPQLIDNIQKIPNLLMTNVKDKNHTQQLIKQLQKNQNQQNILLVILLVILLL